MITLILLSIIVLLGLYGGYQKMTAMDLEKRLKEAEWLVGKMSTLVKISNTEYCKWMERYKKFLGVE